MENKRKEELAREVMSDLALKKVEPVDMRRICRFAIKLINKEYDLKKK